MQTRSPSQKRLKPRSPYAVELRRLGHKVKPSKKAYTRKGRSKDRPFEVWGNAKLLIDLTSSRRR